MMKIDEIQKRKPKKSNYTIDEIVLQNFDQICRKENLKKSQVVEQLLKMFIAQKVA